MAAVGLIVAAELCGHALAGEAQIAQGAAQQRVAELAERRIHLSSAVPVQDSSFDVCVGQRLSQQRVGSIFVVEQRSDDPVFHGACGVAETRDAGAGGLLMLDHTDRRREVDVVDDVTATVVAHGIELALDGQHRHGRPPAVVQPADRIVVTHAGVVHEDLVELAVTGHVPQGANLDAGLAHVDAEERDALVLGHVGVGARHHDGPIGRVSGSGPDLLAVDDPLVAISLGGGPQPCQVRSGAGLGEELTPELFTCGDLGQVAIEEQVGTVFEQCGRHQRHRHPVRRPERPDVISGAIGFGGFDVAEAATEPIGRPERVAPSGLGDEPPPVPHGHLGIPVSRVPLVRFVVDRHVRACPSPRPPLRH